MNVLSLFDGISCGQIALNKSNIKYDKYFASEIDKNAIQITQKNYPNTIQLGDVRNISSNDLPKIDLLIGGSPCQGFSFAGKRLDFDDPRSKLFFEYIRLLEELNPKYFLLENVPMLTRSENVISHNLGIEPITINSSLVSAQNRKRLYWTNIKIKKIKNKFIYLKDILQNNVEERFYIKEKYTKAYKPNNSIISDRNKINIIGNLSPYQGDRVYDVNSKSIALSASAGNNSGGSCLIFRNKRISKLTPIECERLQTVPDNYTDGISDHQRYKVLGNGWTVDVISHIFDGLSKEPKEVKTKERFF